jgi:EAL domain-containing protein (putative c-di-GMP-specific phosphodiesterase class I)
VAVNLSAREFLAPDLARTIGRILQTHAIAPSLLELEITESSLMVNPDEAARTLEYLKTLGVGLAIDDFGTGYSSLSYLKRFPLDALKIDRSFVRDVTSDANDAAITLAVISMAHSLGLAVVAEGVENADQLAFLARHGCDQVQGYYLARPVCAESCTGMLRAAARLPLDVAG